MFVTNCSLKNIDFIIFFSIAIQLWLFCNYLFVLLFFLIYLLIVLLQLSQFPPPHSTPSCPSPPSYIPPLQFMSMGHTYKFFGFYISYTIFTLPLSIFHLSSMLLILCKFLPLSPSHSPIDNPSSDLHLYDSVPVLVVCLVCSCFCFRCGH